MKAVNGLSCPNCGSTNLKVIETRSRVSSLRRRRGCLDCGYRFTTTEFIGNETGVLSSEIVLKGSNEKLYIFDKQGFYDSLFNVCERRGDAMNVMQQINIIFWFYADKNIGIVERIRRNGIKYITMPELLFYKIVSEALKRVNWQTYIRYMTYVIPAKNAEIFLTKVPNYERMLTKSVKDLIKYGSKQKIRELSMVNEQLIEKLLDGKINEASEMIEKNRYAFEQQDEFSDNYDDNDNSNSEIQQEDINCEEAFDIYELENEDDEEIKSEKTRKSSDDDYRDYNSPFNKYF